MAPVALLQQCEDCSTVPFVGVVEHRLHLREHRLSTNGGLREEGGGRFLPSEPLGFNFETLSLNRPRTLATV